MTKTDNTGGDFKALRKKAKRKLRYKENPINRLNKEDVLTTLHELHVHQIELEMQNEQLRQTQQELELSRSRYVDLYDFAPVGYFTFDRNGLVIEANLTGCRMLGIERSSLIKKPFNSFVDKNNQDEFHKHRGAAMTSGLTRTCEITIVRKDKRTFEAQLESVAAADDKGGSNLCRTVITDINERKKVERELIESNERLQLVVESGNAGIWDWDVQTRQVEWNDRLYEMLGLSPGLKNLTPETFYHHVYPQDLPRVQKNLAGVMKSGTEFEDTFRIVRADGDVRWLSSRARLFREDDRKPMRMMGVNYDVTDSRLAEEALRRSEEKFHGLFSTMSEAFVLFELIRNDAGKVIDCRVLDANSAVEKMTGITPADAIGRTMREIFPDADPFWFDTYGQVEATGKPASFERCFEPLDRFYQTNVYRPAPGQIAIVFTDITERRQAEEELRRSNEELNRFNRAMVGREARMIELKKEVNDLCEQAGQAPRYSLDFEEEPM